MGFFDLQKYRHEQHDLERAARDNKLLEERIENLKWQERSAEYEREQEDYRERERLERERENSRELRFNLYEEKRELRDELDDLKLRRKFGIEEGER